MECNQPAGSFKLRGMDYLCSFAAKNGATQFVSSSGGNASLSAAYAGRMMGIKSCPSAGMEPAIAC